MWMFFRKFQLVAGALLVLALSERGAFAGPVTQVANFHHRKWTSENGLGAVFDIQQSPDGYLWLTTSRGVLRFDGVRFQPVGEATYGAVDSNDIDSVFLPSSGGLWLTTTSAGLLFWKDGRLTAFPDRRCTPTRKMGRLVQDSDGALWVQATAGLFRLRGSVCEQIGANEGYPGGFAAGILLDSGGTLWVKTRSGPLLFMPRGQSKFQIMEYGEGVSSSYAFLHEAPDGTIWLSDDQGLRRVGGKPGMAAFSPPPGKLAKRNSRFGDFTFTPDGSLWAVTTKGVQRFDRVEQWPTPQAVETAPGEIFTPQQGLSSDAAWKVLIDREGTTWVGTNSGLDRLRRNVLSKPALPPAQERQFSIAPGDRGSIWTGNSSLPLTQIAADGTLTSFSRTRETTTVRRDHNGTIWSAGAGDFYLWRFSGKDFVPLHYPDEKLYPVVSVAVDRNNAPWITTRSGRVYHLVNGTWSNQNEALGRKPGVMGAMADDQVGNVWFAFSDKVVQWDGSAYHTFVRKTRDISQSTMSVRGDRVWLGGPGGVQLFTQGGFYTMGWKDQDLPGRVSGVVETNTGDLWVNGFSGIAHVSSAELKRWLSDPGSAVSAERFDELDGLPGVSGERIPEPSVVEASDGRLWFATTKGIAWLDPTTLEKNRNRLPPPVVVSAVISNGKRYPGANGLTLPAHSENLEIDYTALSLAMPERVLFRYKLDGVDSDWQNVGTRRQAYYTKLRPGPYKFQVMACNNDGVWNEAGALLNLTLSPAWFQTTWFALLCLACGVVILSLIYQLRVRHIAAEINARFEERLDERTRIAQELHDTLLQGFLSASMQVHVATDQLAEDSPIKPMLTRSLDVMGQVIEEGRNALRGLRSSRTLSLDLEQAFAGIQKEFDAEGTNETPVEFRVMSDGRQRPLNPLLRDEIYRIGREALTNAFRHSRANRIEIELKYSSGDFRLLVRDDGCGIHPHILRTGREGHWGLSGMRERADRMGARLHIFSRPSGGTELELSVPGRVAFQNQPARGLRWFRKASPSMTAQAPIESRRRT